MYTNFLLKNLFHCRQHQVFPYFPQYPPQYILRILSMETSFKPRGDLSRKVTGVRGPEIENLTHPYIIFPVDPDLQIFDEPFLEGKITRKNPVHLSEKSPKKSRKSKKSQRNPKNPKNPIEIQKIQKKSQKSQQSQNNPKNPNKIFV